jgi:phage host-nuclease inhibitor protein Gam
MNTRDRLAEMGVIPDEDELSPTGQRWQVATKQDLEFALKRLGELKAQAQHIETAEALAISQVQSRAHALISRVNKGIEYFEKQIAAYAEENRQALLGTGKRKTWSGLHGSVSWRKKGGRLRVADKEALCEWLRFRPDDGKDLGEMKEVWSPNLSNIQRHHESTGEIPPGMEFEPERDELSITAEPPIEGLSKLEE